MAKWYLSDKWNRRLNVAVLTIGVFNVIYAITLYILFVEAVSYHLEK